MIRKGDKYNYLTVTALFPDEKTVKGFKCFCLCDCGKEITAYSNRIVKGLTKSCGCARARANIKRTIHGHDRRGKASSEYMTWYGMIARCHRENHISYKFYGAKGITVCERWRVSFINFLNDMGQKPGPKFTIDRIDNTKGYEPSNCRWVTYKTQQNNKSSNRILTYNNVSKNLSQWGEIFDINPSAIINMLKKGRSFNQIYEYYTGPRRAKKRKIRDHV